MKTIIVLNGKDFNHRYFENNYQQDDFIIVADGGIRIANKYGIKTDLFIGDLDSSSSAESKEARNKIILAKEKDYSDFHICLQYLVDNRPNDQIVVYNGTGGRMDHAIAIYDTCIHFADRLNIELVSSTERIIFKSKSFIVNNNKGKTASLFSGLSEVENLSLEGFYYQVENYNLKRTFPLGLSNIITSTQAKVSFSRGIVVIFINF